MKLVIEIVELVKVCVNLILINEELDKFNVELIWANIRLVQVTVKYFGTNFELDLAWVVENCNEKSECFHFEENFG